MTFRLSSGSSSCVGQRKKALVAALTNSAGVISESTCRSNGKVASDSSCAAASPTVW